MTKIKQITKFYIFDTLLELCFKVESEEGFFFLKAKINDDGETINVSRQNGPLENHIISDDYYSQILNNKDEGLGRLINNNILSLSLGVENNFPDKVYYLLINTAENNFLFFNNGDEGFYTFDNINNMIENDVYDIKWSNIIDSNIIQIPPR